MVYINIFCKRLKFYAKILTILFWSSLYLVAMKMNVLPIFSSNTDSEIKQSYRILSDTTETGKQGTIIELSLGNTTKEVKETDEQIQLILEGRSKAMETMCQAKPRPEETIKRQAFFINSDYSLLWCSVFKAASTQWLHKLILLARNGNATLNMKPKKHMINIARELYPLSSVSSINNTLYKPGVTSLIIVREPFVRILSAYRNKLEGRSVPYYKKISTYIIQNYRNKSNRPIRPKKTWPTFEEFVNFLVDPKNEVDDFDEHWIPYSKYCTPCTIKYTTIAKVESLDRDNKFIENKLGIDKMLRGQPTNTRTINKSMDGKKTVNLLKRYFGQLNFETLKNLIKVYEDDFDLFGYDKKPYYGYVKNKL